MPLDGKIDVSVSTTPLDQAETPKTITELMTLVLDNGSPSPLRSLSDDISAIDADTNLNQTQKEQKVEQKLNLFFTQKCDFYVSNDYKQQIQNTYSYNIFLKSGSTYVKFFDSPTYDQSGEPSGPYADKIAEMRDEIARRYPMIGSYLEKLVVEDTVRNQLVNLLQGIVSEIDTNLSSIQSNENDPQELLNMKNTVNRTKALIQMYLNDPNLSPAKRVKYQNSLDRMNGIQQKIYQAEIQNVLNDVNTYHEYMKDRYMHTRKNLEVLRKSNPRVADIFPVKDKIDIMEQNIKMLDKFLLDTNIDFDPLQKRDLNIQRDLFQNMLDYLNGYQKVVDIQLAINTIKNLKLGDEDTADVDIVGTPTTIKGKDRKDKIKALENQKINQIGTVNSLSSVVTGNLFETVMTDKEMRKRLKAQEKEEQKQQQQQQTETTNNNAALDRSLIDDEGNLTDLGKQFVEEHINSKFSTMSDLDSGFEKVLTTDQMRKLVTTCRGRTAKYDRQECVQKVCALKYHEAVYLLKYMEVMSDISKSNAAKANQFMSAEFEIMLEQDGSRSDLRKLNNKIQDLLKKYKGRNALKQKIVTGYYQYVQQRMAHNYYSAVFNESVSRLNGTNIPAISQSMGFFGFTPPCEPTLAYLAGCPQGQMSTVFDASGLDQAQLLRILQNYGDFDPSDPSKAPPPEIWKQVDNPIEPGDIASFVEKDGGIDWREYDFSNEMLMTIYFKYKAQREGAKMETYGTGAGGVLQEIALRHITGRNQFNFLAEVDKFGGKSYSPEEKIEMLRECMFHLLTPDVATYIRNKYEPYKKKVDSSDPRMFELVSMFFIGGVANKFSGSYEGVSSGEGFKTKMFDSLQSLFDGGWDAHAMTPGNGATNPWTKTRGNIAVGQALMMYSTKPIPEGLGYTPDWLTKDLSLRERLFHENGARAGAIPAMEGWLKSQAVAIGMDPKNIPTVIATTKILLGAYGISLGRQVLQYLWSGGRAARIQKFGVAGGLIYGLSPYIFKGNIIQAGKKALWGDKNNEGFLNTGVNSLIAKAGGSDEDLKIGEETMQYRMMVGPVFEHMTMGQIRQFILPQQNPLTGKYEWTMDHDQYIKYLDTYDTETQSPDVKLGVATLKSLYSHFGSNMIMVSDYLGRGLSASGLNEDDPDAFNTYTTGRAYKDMLFIDFQHSHGLFAKYREKLLPVFAGDETRMNTILERFIGMSQQERAMFEEKIEYLGQFRSKLAERLPYISDYFLKHRDVPVTGLDATVDLLAEVGLVTADVAPSVAVYEDLNALNDLFADYLLGDMLGSTTGTQQQRQTVFENAYVDQLPTTNGQAFTRTFVIAPNDLNLGTGLEGFLAKAATTTPPETLANLARVRGDASATWIVGNHDFNGNIFPSPPLQETLLTNIPGSQSSELMVGVDQNTNVLYFYVKNQNDGKWERYNLKKIGDKGASIYGIGYNDALDKMTIDFLDDEKHKLFTVDYKLFENMAKTLISGSQSFRMTYQELDPQNAINNGQWNDNIYEQIFGSVADRLSGGRKIEFEKVPGDIRPKW